MRFATIKILAAAAAAILVAAPAAASTDKALAKAVVPVEFKADGDLTAAFVIGETGGVKSPYANVEAYEIELPSGAKGEFVVDFEVPGTYRYEIKQQPPSDGAAYDKSVYEVEAFVTQDDDGTGSVDVVAWKKGSTEKSTACSFTNLTLSGDKPGEGETEPGDKPGDGKEKETEKDSGKATPGGDSTSTSKSGGSSISTPPSSGGSSGGSSSGGTSVSPGSGSISPPVQTGDETPIGKYVAMIVAANLAAIIAIAALLKRRRREEEN